MTFRVGNVPRYVSFGKPETERSEAGVDMEDLFFTTSADHAGAQRHVPDAGSLLFSSQHWDAHWWISAAPQDAAPGLNIRVGKIDGKLWKSYKDHNYPGITDVIGCAGMRGEMACVVWRSGTGINVQTKCTIVDLAKKELGETFVLNEGQPGRIVVSSVAYDSGIVRIVYPGDDGIAYWPNLAGEGLVAPEPYPGYIGCAPPARIRDLLGLDMSWVLPEEHDIRACLRVLLSGLREMWNTSGKRRSAAYFSPSLPGRDDPDIDRFCMSLFRESWLMATTLPKLTRNTVGVSAAVSKEGVWDKIKGWVKGHLGTTGGAVANSWNNLNKTPPGIPVAVSYTHLRAHETDS